MLRVDQVEQYRSVQKAIWNSLVRLHTNLALIRQVNVLPWIGAKGSAQLFGYFAANLLDYSVVIAHRVWADRDAKSMTLHRLGRLLLTGSKPEWKDAVKGRLRILRDVRPSAEVVKRIGRIRDKNLAHLDEGYHFDPDERLGPVSLDEFEEVADRLGRYYNGLSVGSASMFVVANYSWSEPEDGPLGYMHELLVARSSKSAAFDDDLQYWERRVRPELSAEEMERLNAARRRVGLEDMS